MNKKVWNLVWDAIKNLNLKNIIYLILQNLSNISSFIVNPILIKSVMDAIQRGDEISFWFRIKFGIIYIRLLAK